jgi:hypothetical protein
MSESLHKIISKLWTTPERAEWTPKTDVVMLSDDQRWMASGDIEILGFTRALLSAQRMREMFCKEPKNEAEFRVGFGFCRARDVFGGGLRKRSAEGHARRR